MKAISFTYFKNNLVNTFDAVNKDKDIIIVSRKKNNSVVILDLNEYKSIMETLYLTCTYENHKRLEESLEEMKIC